MLGRWMNLLFLVMVIMAAPGFTIKVILRVTAIVGLLILVGQELAQHELNVSQSLLLSLYGLFLKVNVMAQVLVFCHVDRGRSRLHGANSARESIATGFFLVV